METLYTEGELMQPHNDFHHFHYSKVVDFDADGVADDAKLPARLLRLRAQIATGHAADVLTEIKSEAASSPDLGAVQALALYASGKTDQGLKQAEKLATANADNANVQVLAGTVLQAAGESEAALALLAKHQGSLEAVALATQIHLQQNRTDLALKEVQAAKKWAQDSLLVNIAESWVGLRIGGDRYQQAFYEFEEMPVPQAVAELHLGRLPEAEAALQQVLKEQPDDAQALANTIVLHTLAGKDAAEATATLKAKDSKHPLLEGLSEKGDQFDTAAAKYAAK